MILGTQAFTPEEANEFLGDALDQVFRVMVGLPVVRLGLTDTIGGMESSVTAVVGLAGTVSGSIFISMPQTLARALTAYLLMMDLAEIDSMSEEVEDAVGEVANIVAGAVKDYFSKGGFDIGLSLPTVITGTWRKVGPSRDKNCISAVFSVEGEPMQVAIICRRHGG